MKEQAAGSDDFTQLDDDQLISQRSALRGRLEQMPEHDRRRAPLVTRYRVLTGEFDRRARAAWQQATPRPCAASSEPGSDPAGQQP